MHNDKYLRSAEASQYPLERKDFCKPSKMSLGMITSQASSECLMKMVKNEGLGFKILSFFALFFFIVSLLLFLREEERERKKKKQKHPSAASSEPLTGVWTCDRGSCPDWESNPQPCWCTGRSKQLYLSTASVYQPLTECLIYARNLSNSNKEGQFVFLGWGKWDKEKLSGAGI